MTVSSNDQVPSSAGRSWMIRLAGLGVAAAVLGLMVATEPKLAIVWDEGFTLGREGRVRSWIEAMRDPPRFAATWVPESPLEELVQPTPGPAPRRDQVDTRAKLLDQHTLEWFWPFAREEPHGHPPFYGLVGLLGDVFVPRWAPLPRARFGPMLVFSLTSGALFVFLATRSGIWAGITGAGALVLQPRLFAHAHYAHYDDILTCLWIGSILSFSKAVERRDGRNPRWFWAVVFGMVAGAAAGTKLTGWFLPVPFLVWTAIRRDRRGTLTILVGGIVALVTLYALTPPWWNNPVSGVERFLRSNLTRAQTTLIPTLFLGEVILTPQNSLPWYNTLVWTGFVTPVGILALALVGASRSAAWARSRPVESLAALHWGFLLVLRSLPHTPGHDGERQFLAAFGCLAIVAGWGGGWLVERLGRWGKLIVVASLAEAAVGLALAMPVPLSYYSPAVGGLPGAARLGMEPTYYWDSLTDDALAWINQNTPRGRKVMFPTYPSTWRFLRQTGKLQVDCQPYEPGLYTWFILQNRPGSFQPHEVALVNGSAPRHVLTERSGVPLLWAFPFAEFTKAWKESRRDPP